MTSTVPPPAETLCCVRPGDFLDPQARSHIAKVLAPFLVEHHLTPLELLHSAKALKALQSHATLAPALTRTAELQAGLMKKNTAQREGELKSLASDYFKLVRDRITKQPPHLISKTTDLITVTQAAQKMEEEGNFFLFASLAHTLEVCSDALSKVEKLVSLAQSCQDEWTRAHLDILLGETLAQPGVCRALWRANPDDLTHFLFDLADLARGEPVAKRLRQKRVVQLAALLEGTPMDATRAGLVHALQDEVEAAEHLVATVQDDLLGQKALMADLMATAELARRLRGPKGFVGGQRSHDVLDRRVSLLISSTRLQDLLRGQPIHKKLEHLFSLKAAVAGTASTRTIDDFILMLLDSRDLVGRLFDVVLGPEQRAKALADLQGMVLASSFPVPERKRLATQLDNAQHDFLRTTSLLASLRKATPPVDSVLTVADQIAQGLFTQGRCIREARELVRRHVRRKDFVRTFLKTLEDSIADTTEEPGNRPSVAEALRTLSDRIKAAGVPFRDLSALSVLVVDDEESARAYVEMVLRDMGIGQVMTAHDGRAALETFQDFEDGIDLIVCDWMMPRMSGLDFLKQVRSVRPDLPFLMVTALATIENVQEAMSHDVTAYIAKPFPPEQLEEKVLLLVNRPSHPSPAPAAPPAAPSS